MLSVRGMWEDGGNLQKLKKSGSMESLPILPAKGRRLVPRCTDSKPLGHRLSGTPAEMKDEGHGNGISNTTQEKTGQGA